MEESHSREKIGDVSSGPADQQELSTGTCSLAEKQNAVPAPHAVTEACPTEGASEAASPNRATQARVVQAAEALSPTSKLAVPRTESSHSRDRPPQREQTQCKLRTVADRRTECDPRRVPSSTGSLRDTFQLDVSDSSSSGSSLAEERDLTSSSSLSLSEGEQEWPSSTRPGTRSASRVTWSGKTSARYLHSTPRRSFKTNPRPRGKPLCDMYYGKELFPDELYLTLRQTTQVQDESNFAGNQSAVSCARDSSETTEWLIRRRRSTFRRSVLKSPTLAGKAPRAAHQWKELNPRSPDQSRSIFTPSPQLQLDSNPTGNRSETSEESASESSNGLQPSPTQSGEAKRQESFATELAAGPGECETTAQDANSKEGPNSLHRRLPSISSPSSALQTARLRDAMDSVHTSLPGWTLSPVQGSSRLEKKRKSEEPVLADPKRRKASFLNASLLSCVSRRLSSGRDLGFRNLRRGAASKSLFSQRGRERKSQVETSTMQSGEDAGVLGDLQGQGGAGTPPVSGAMEVEPADCSVTPMSAPRYTPRPPASASSARRFGRNVPKMGVSAILLSSPQKSLTESLLLDKYSVQSWNTGIRDGHVSTMEFVSNSETAICTSRAISLPYASARTEESSMHSDRTLEHSRLLEKSLEHSSEREKPDGVMSPFMTSLLLSRPAVLQPQTPFPAGDSGPARGHGRPTEGGIHHHSTPVGSRGECSPGRPNGTPQHCRLRRASSQRPPHYRLLQVPTLPEIPELPTLPEIPELLTPPEIPELLTKQPEQGDLRTASIKQTELPTERFLQTRMSAILGQGSAPPRRDDTDNARQRARGDLAGRSFVWV